MARDPLEYDVGGELRDQQGRRELVVKPKHTALLSSDVSRGYEPADADGRVQTVLLDANGNDLATTMATTTGGALAPFPNSTRISTSSSSKLRDIVSLADFPGFDRTATQDQSPVLRAAIAEVQATAQAGYGANRSGSVLVPQGRYLLRSKVQIPENTAIVGSGFSTTTFMIPQSGFQDNCVFEPTLIDTTQEFIGLSGFTLYGQNSGSLPVNHQANAGVATTVLTTITGFFPFITYGTFTLAAVGDLSAYAPSGTLLVGGKRVIYQSVDTANRLFKNCYIISNDIGKPITAGDAITAVTQWNISGIHFLGVAFPSYLRDLWTEYFSQSCVISGNITATEIRNVNAAFAGRHAYQHLCYRPVNYWSNLNGLYPGNDGSGNPYACLYVVGSQAVSPFGNGMQVETFYGGMTAANSIGIWLQNASITGSNLNIQEGVADASHTGLQIDTDKSNPLFQDGAHATNINIHSLAVNGIGRVPLRDNVRGHVLPANTTQLGIAISRYTTEDYSPGVAGPFVPNSPYLDGSLVNQNGEIWRRYATGIGASTFSATEQANWMNLGKANREKLLRRGTLLNFSETYPSRDALISTLGSLTSGTQYGAPIPVFAGETYGHASMVSSGAATWGTNADGHWYIAVYDASGNLVTQTADGGAVGLGAFTSVTPALLTPISPTVDALYRIVLMVYVGTGGAPVMPTFRSVAGFTGTTLTGLPQETFSANAGQTTGVAPGTIGTLGGALTSKPWLALST